MQELWEVSIFTNDEDEASRFNCNNKYDALELALIFAKYYGLSLFKRAWVEKFGLLELKDGNTVTMKDGITNLTIKIDRP